MIRETLEFLFLEDEEIRAESYSVLIAIVFLIFGIITTFYLTYKFRKDLHDLVDIKFVILPVYRITWLMLIRYIISFVDFIIWYIRDGKTSLNGFYESVLWIAIIIQFYIIISDQDLIQISRTRIERFDLLLFILKVMLSLAMIILFIINFLIDNIFLETLSLILFVILSYQIYKIIKIEMENVKSIINKIRLNYLINFWKYFIVYFLSIIIGYGMMGSLYPDGNINGLYFIVVAFFMGNFVRTFFPLLLSVTY